MAKDQPSAAPLGLRASMWAGPTVLMAQAVHEANVVPAAVEGDKDLADPVEAAEQSLAEGVAGPAAVQEAAKTVRGISGAHVTSMSAVVEGDRISQYRTTVDIAFAVER